MLDFTIAGMPGNLRRYREGRTVRYVWNAQDPTWAFDTPEEGFLDMVQEMEKVIRKERQYAKQDRS